jgi:hypothetical protein
VPPLGIVGGGVGTFLSKLAPGDTLVHDIEPGRGDVAFNDVLDRCTHVVVAVPNELHFALSSRLLVEGKRVLVLKPIVLTHEEACTLLDMAGQFGGRVVPGFNQRYRRELEGIGKVEAANLWWSQRAQPQRRPFYSVKYDLGVHMLDLAFKLLGAIAPTRVWAAYEPGIDRWSVEAESIKIVALRRSEVAAESLRFLLRTDTQEVVISETGPVEGWGDHYTFERMLSAFVDDSCAQLGEHDLEVIRWLQTW